MNMSLTFQLCFCLPSLCVTLTFKLWQQGLRRRRVWRQATQPFRRFRKYSAWKSVIKKDRMANALWQDTTRLPKRVIWATMTSKMPWTPTMRSLVSSFMNRIWQVQFNFLSMYKIMANSPSGWVCTKYGYIVNINIICLELLTNNITNNPNIKGIKERKEIKIHCLQTMHPFLLKMITHLLKP